MNRLRTLIAMNGYGYEPLGKDWRSHLPSRDASLKATHPCALGLQWVRNGKDQQSARIKPLSAKKQRRLTSPQGVEHRSIEPTSHIKTFIIKAVPVVVPEMSPPKSPSA